MNKKSFVVLLSGFTACLVACERKHEGTGAVSLRFPSAKEVSSNKYGRLSLDFAKVCYLANVVGGTIQSQKSSDCDVAIGIHSPFQKPDSKAELMIPRGMGYKLEIYAYANPSASEPCPTMNGRSFSGFSLTKISLVGTSTFDVQTAEVDVTVSVSDPGTHVASNGAMPISCIPGANESGGSILVSTGGLRLYRAVNSEDSGKSLISANGKVLELGKDGSK